MHFSGGITGLIGDVSVVVTHGEEVRNKAVAQIPLGTAYAVWTGIGTFGTAVIGMLFLKIRQAT